MALDPVEAVGFLLPVGALLVPLLAPQRDWSASATGAVVAAMALGAAAVALRVLLRLVALAGRTLRRSSHPECPGDC
ncbi:hypothetical protein [Verrucosispora sp. WMMD573]|uniref:hypothetical protein n=1 Tax=Verrucosispora sp. WMMD573 TaxID=3015149 RepID=UPI00248C0F7B|nr:hypothetical protein [Verrucosispora sp. WMMD573]WBB52922.1 hypothetical protein O7601_20385 [Verrucosispora sp. WMMD573]